MHSSIYEFDRYAYSQPNLKLHPEARDGESKLFLRKKMLHMKRLVSYQHVDGNSDEWMPIMFLFYKSNSKATNQ